MKTFVGYLPKNIGFPNYTSTFTDWRKLHLASLIRMPLHLNKEHNAWINRQIESLDSDDNMKLAS